MIELAEMHRLAEAAALLPGDQLDAIDIALIRLGVAVSVTSLDRGAITSAIDAAIAAGASPVQVQEIISLVSGLGVHSLMVTMQHVAQAAGLTEAPLTAEQQGLWDRHVGDDPFWQGFEVELPGFLRAMLQLSSDQFAAFFDYCAVPWRSGQVRARIKELAAMACDATPAHRFLPGYRLHLANAVKLGAGRLAIGEALAIAAAAPEHHGTC